MDFNKPTLLVISGPNGAGKSTHIQAMLPEAFSDVRSFDRDLTRAKFERQLFADGVAAELIPAQAMRLMEKVLLSEMDIAIHEKKHFVLETPLSHPDYWKYIDRFETRGYQVQLNYLCLDSIKDCEARVQFRVTMGGHFVDARTIKGVYEMNLKYINELWDIFSVIELYDGMRSPVLLAKLEEGIVIFARQNAVKKNWVSKGFSSLALKIERYLQA